MVKKKGKDDDTSPKFVTKEELLVREQRYLQRLQDIRICIGFINDAIEDNVKLRIENLLQEHWERFLSCDGLPRPYCPPELRSFIAEARHVDVLDEHEHSNWTLSIDERSILTQDIFRIDHTRKTLIKDAPNIGKNYERFVNRILQTLYQIDYMLDDDIAMKEVPMKTALEVVLMRDELQQEIEVLYDRLTYRIICADEANMASRDGKVATYCYKGENYTFEIWCLRNVPILFKQIEPPLMVADFSCAGARVQIPLSVLTDCLTLRCVHSFFDTRSEHAKGYEPYIDKAASSLNAGIMDIEDCLINEWVMQLDIQDELFQQFEQRKMLYEETLTAALSRGDKILSLDEAKKLKLKLPKEPQLMPEGMYPDPYSIFMEREQKQFLEFLEEFYSPDNLDLRRGEVNLRRFIMLGGNFSLMFVRKPHHTAYEKFNITLHEDGRILYTMFNVTADLGYGKQYGNSLLRAASSRAIRSTIEVNVRRSVNKQAPAPGGGGVDDMHLEVDELPYFYVTFELPKHLCMWGEPVVCHYLEEVEPERIVVEVPREETEHPVAKKRKEKPKVKGVEHTRGGGSVDTIEAGKSVHRLQSAIVRRNTDPNNFYRSTMLTRLRFSARRLSILPAIALENFALNMKPLTQRNLRNLERHLLPRILSSFRFPIDFKEQADEEQVGKKPRINMLVRRQEDESEPEVEYFFNFEDQKAAERLYPVFGKRERLLYRSELENASDGTSDATEVDSVETPHLDLVVSRVPEPSMYSAIKTFDDIYYKYEAGYKNVMSQQPFIIKQKVVKQAVTTEAPNQMIREPSTMRLKNLVRLSLLKGKKLGSTHDQGKRGNFPGSEMDLSALTGKASHDFLMRDPDQLSVHSDSKPQARRSDQSGKSQAEETDAKPKVIHWTTRYIYETQFDKERFKITIKTDRLGIFGFAFKRYAHFPFRHWCVQPNEENNNEIMFQLDTFLVRVTLFISNKGIRGYVTDILKEFVAKPVKYLVIDKPISDYNELKRRFREKNCNIFAEADAGYYIENGYFSQKHLACELHVYDAISMHCKLMRFTRSNWNRLATRRNIVLRMRNPKDPSDSAEVTARVTPESSTFVEIQELCSDDLNVFKLEYTLTWRNIGLYTDVHQLICSMYPQATDVRNRDPKLIYYIRKLLFEVRPLSYS